MSEEGWAELLSRASARCTGRRQLAGTPCSALQVEVLIEGEEVVLLGIVDDFLDMPMPPPMATLF